MRNVHSVVALSLALAFVLGGCETVTDLGEVEMSGTWDAVGSLNQEVEGALSLSLSGSGSGFDGTWVHRNESRQAIANGTVTEGLNDDGEVTFRLHGLGGEEVVFSGRLTNAFRLEGELSAYHGGTAVFRKRSSD